MIFTNLPKTAATLAAIVCLAGCEAAKSANPTAPTVAGPLPGVSITAPKPLEPEAGTTLTFSTEPPTLLIENAGSSGVRTLWLQVEVGTDAGFQQVVHSADRLTPGDGGRTTYRLPEPLGAGFTYYWRSRAQDGANTGPYSNVSTFTVVPPVVIDPPTPIAPTGTVSTNRPDFRVTNGNISGTTGVVYRFEVSTTADMSRLSAIVTAAPGNGTTTTTLGELPYSTTFYWRVYGSDGGTQSAYSSTLSFRTPAAPAPPAPTPGPSTGVPLGTGGRGPDNGPLPNMFAVVQAVARANPSALQSSCQSGGGTWQFMDLVVDTLRTYDSRWGYNGKRGNINDPSHDVVAYNYGSGADQGSTSVYIIDVISGHCGPTPGPSWVDVTGVTLSSGSIGRWTSRGRF